MFFCNRKNLHCTLQLEFKMNLMENLFLPTILLSGFRKCPPRKHKFGADASVFVCYSKDVLLDCFGSYTHMAGMVNPMRRAEYIGQSERNPGGIQFKSVGALRELAIAELGEAYPPAFERPGRKTKNPPIGWLKTLISMNRWDKKTYTAMSGAYSIRCSKTHPFFFWFKKPSNGKVTVYLDYKLDGVDYVRQGSSVISREKFL